MAKDMLLEFSFSMEALLKTLNDIAGENLETLTFSRFSVSRNATPKTRLHGSQTASGSGERKFRTSHSTNRDLLSTLMPY